ncbi:class I SAM-dependent methyltransferase [Streptomyces sp. ISL-11]|uniref:class I SAM-dependent methyltransferase n=1 Tax=Streptomyces sp. ISL-11 TaxID=2819174 RepID=UPI001BE6CB81|nr:class I SAM-dependent methyltransferase [Streptomyces sp. ISL-11]MBT2383600.1 methyltransferase domain-containing protein [Streptomyces sp. ISL-11]
MPRTPVGCYAFISHRLIRAALGDSPSRDVRWITPVAGMRCAEIGSGGGYYTTALAARLGPGSLLVAVDPAAHDPRARRGTGPGAATAHIAGDGCALPFASASLDALLYSYSLEEMPDPHAALAEAGRVLRPGGQLALFLWRPLMRRRGLTSLRALGSRDGGFVLLRAHRGPQNLRLAYRKR